MNCDSSKTLLETCGSAREVRRQLLSAVGCMTNRDGSQKWAKSLRFLTPPRKYDSLGNIISEHTDGNGVLPGVGPFPDISLEPGDDPNINDIKKLMDRRGCPCLSLTSRPFRMQDALFLQFDLVTIPNCTHYTAISYNWRNISPDDDFDNPAARTLIRLENGGFRSARTPVSTLRRAVYHAIWRGDTSIWIDQDCIEQDNDIDKQLGIYAMDLVYKRALHTVGLLNYTFDHDDQIDILAKWVGSLDFDEDVKLKIGKEEQESLLLSMMLQGISSDRWFQRAWCAHERFSARDITLSIGYDLQSHKESRTPRQFDVGDTTSYIGQCPLHMLGSRALATTWPPGEATFDPMKLVERIERFCRSTEANIQELFMPPVIQLRDMWGLTGSVDVERLNMGRAWKVFQNLSCTFDSDKLAILSNICQYKRHINTKLAENQGLSFSVCVLALMLMNGDETLLCKDLSHTAELVDGVRSSNRDPMEVVPKQWSTSWLAPLSKKLDDSMCIRSMRKQSTVSLTQRGLKVKGWTFLMTEFIPLEALQEYVKESMNQAGQSPTKNEVDSQKRSFWWSLLIYFTQNGYESIAESLWRILRPETQPIDDNHGTLEFLSTELSSILDFQTGRFIPPTFVSPTGERRLLTDFETFGLLASGYMDYVDWIRLSILKHGGIWSGVLKTQQQGPTVILSSADLGPTDSKVVIARQVRPYTSSRESNLISGYGLKGSKATWCRRLIRTQPLSWLATSEDHNSPHRLGKPCNCFFDHDTIPTSIISLAWSEGYEGEALSDIDDLASFESSDDDDGSATIQMPASDDDMKLDGTLGSNKTGSSFSISFRNIMTLPTSAERVSSFQSSRQIAYQDDIGALSSWVTAVLEDFPEHASLLSSQDFLPNTLPLRTRRWSEQLNTAKNTVASLNSRAQSGTGRLQRNLSEGNKSLRTMARGVKSKSTDKAETLWEKTRKISRR